MRSSEYVQCRLTADTHRRLTALAVRLKSKARRKPGEFLPSLTQGKVGLSDVIDQLIWQLDNEEMRKASYGKAKRWKPEIQQRKPGKGEVDRMLAEGCPNVD